MFVKLVKCLLKEKPQDPIPFIYSYLKQVSEGSAEPVPPTNKDVAEAKNLRKKLEYLKSQLTDGNDSNETEESE